MLNTMNILIFDFQRCFIRENNNFFINYVNNLSRIRNLRNLYLEINMYIKAI